MQIFLCLVFGFLLKEMLSFGFKFEYFSTDCVNNTTILSMMTENCLWMMVIYQLLNNTMFANACIAHMDTKSHSLTHINSMCRHRQLTLLQLTVKLPQKKIPMELSTTAHFCCAAGFCIYFESDRKVSEVIAVKLSEAHACYPFEVAESLQQSINDDPQTE